MGVAGSASVVATRDPLFWRCYAFDDGDGFDFVAEGERLARRLNGVDDDDDWDEEELFSGEYAGYSNRNDCHSRFPFAEFTEFRRQLAVADGPEGRS